MSTIHKRFTIDGVLTDPTSMVLEDAAAAYGVKRSDTGAVIVAAGTAMTRNSLGDYSHAFTDPAFDLAYPYVVKVVYGGSAFYYPGVKIGPSAPALAAEAKLAAVNRMLRAIHEYPVAALDTGGVSSAAFAETVLDEFNREIQAEGWHCNRENDLSLDPVDTTKMAVVIAAGAWTAATKTLTKAAAFAAYEWVSGDQIYVSGGTGVTAGWYEIASCVSDDAIVLKDSIADADNADTTTTLIGWEGAIVLGADVLRVDSYLGSASKDVVLRNGMLYDRDNNTFTFDGAVTVTLIRRLSFTHLTQELRDYIVATAAVEFQDALVAGRAKDATLRDRAVRALMKARRAEQDVAQCNVLGSEYALRLQGHSYISQEVRR